MIRLVAPWYDDSDGLAIQAGGSPERMAQRTDVHELEQRLADRINSRGAVLTSSGTAALHLSLQALGVGPGNTVVVPTYTCIAVAHAVHLVGATCRLVDNTFDADKMDFNLDVELALDRAKSAAAVIAPHTFGVVADLSPLLSAGVPIVEDCAMALGCSLEGKEAGGTGAFTTYSFHDTKIISADRGGAVLARSSESMSRLNEATGYTESMAAVRLTPENEVSGAYRMQLNYEMANASAALAKNQLSRLYEFNFRRDQIASYYDSTLDKTGVGLPLARTGGTVPFRYMVDVSRCGTTPSAVILQLEEYGIEGGRGVYPTLDTYFGENPDDYPNAHRAVASLVSIPVWPGLSDTEVEHVASSLVSILSG